ncbi:hypothetical protein KUTeg_022551 [Tegillarca granosa]|uniref:Uncharacterized protein n=1 Tax=Tegillarca granosa TaxID=220873 RepID=A0ABQ9EBU3_TEGGR|nr:hypothetical protein KUTeg_022551 [Tegillarca granosa]
MNKKRFPYLSLKVIIISSYNFGGMIYQNCYTFLPSPFGRSLIELGKLAMFETSLGITTHKGHNYRSSVKKTSIEHHKFKIMKRKKYGEHTNVTLYRVMSATVQSSIQLLIKI